MICNCKSHSVLDSKKILPIKLLAKVNGFTLIRWKLNSYLSGFKKVKGAQAKWIT